MCKKFSDFNLDPGDYWAYLRQLNFNFKDASGRLEEKIIDLMETKCVKSDSAHQNKKRIYPQKTIKNRTMSGV